MRRYVKSLFKINTLTCGLFDNYFKDFRQQKNSASSATSIDKSPQSAFNDTLLLSLEKRYLFDGAAVATATDAVQSSAEQVLPTNADSDAAAQSLLNALNPTNQIDTDNAQKNEVAFIDSRIIDYQSLVDGIGENIDVVILNAEQNGVEQIAATLNGRQVDAIHIVSHGDDGMLLLGNITLNTNTLNDHTNSLLAIGQSLNKSGSDRGDILLYGCDVGRGAEGEAFVNALSDLTEADIAASTDDTGNSELSGDWDLEYNIGNIAADTAFSDTAIAVYDHLFALPISGNQTTNYDGLGLSDTAVINNGTVIDDISYDGWRFNGFGGETGVYAHEGSLTNDVNTTGTRFYTSDSSNVIKLRD